MTLFSLSATLHALGSWDAFLRSVGAQALRGGLAKNIHEICRRPTRNAVMNTRFVEDPRGTQ